MAKRLYNTNLTRVPRETDFEHPVGESMTVPDMTLSLRELIVRYTRGESVPVFNGSYSPEDDDELIPDPRSLDLSDIADRRADLDERVRQFQSRRRRPRKEPDEVRKPAEGGKPQESGPSGQDG